MNFKIWYFLLSVCENHKRINWICRSKEYKPSFGTLVHASLNVKTFFSFKYPTSHSKNIYIYLIWPSRLWEKITNHSARYTRERVLFLFSSKTQCVLCFGANPNNLVCNSPRMSLASPQLNAYNKVLVEAEKTEVTSETHNQGFQWWWKEGNLTILCSLGIGEMNLYIKAMTVQ